MKKTKSKDNFLLSFLVGLAISSLLFIQEIVLDNRARTAWGTILIVMVFGILESIPFIYLAKKAHDTKNHQWLQINVAVASLILVWAIFISLIVFALKDVQFKLPD